MTTQTDRAINELRLAGLYDEDSDYGGNIGRCVEELLRCMQTQGHSGFSHGLTLDIFNTVASGKCLTQLTGEPNEWVDVSIYSDQSPYFQNKRCSSVFADYANGVGAYDIDAETFVDADGSSWCGDRVYIKFPYTPRTIYVNVPKYSPKNVIRRFGKWLAKI